MAKLFTQEVPEIYDGIIEIKAVARDQEVELKYLFSQEILALILWGPVLVCVVAVFKLLSANCKVKK